MSSQNHAATASHHRTARASKSIWHLLVAITCLIASAPASAQESNPTTATNFDRPSPGDNFYEHVNAEWLATYTLPPDRPGYVMAQELRNATESDFRKILENLNSTPQEPASNEQRLGDLYASILDIDAINARGIEPLQPYLDRIRSIKTIKGLVEIFGTVGYRSPIQPDVRPSPFDSSRNYLWLGQGGLGLPHAGYYRTMYFSAAPIRKAYRDHIERILTLIEIPNPEQASDRIYALERKIALTHRPVNRATPAADQARMIDRAELAHIASEINWDHFFNSAGMQDVSTIILRQDWPIADVAELIASHSIEDWKLWLQFHFVDGYSRALPEPFYLSGHEFYAVQFGGLQEPPERWRLGLQAVEQFLANEIDQLYVETRLSTEHLDAVNAMVQNIQSTFEARIRELEWMDDATREKALIKLAAIKGNIGHPDHWPASPPELDHPVSRTEPVRNIHTLIHASWERTRARIDQPVDDTEWPVPAYTVNAFYNRMANRFILPAGILQAPMFNPDDDPAQSYGRLGAVIAHEFSHAFDDQGRQFNASGEVDDWWTKATTDRFTKEADRLKRQYSSYCQGFAKCVNAAGTIGENIADLSGLQLAWYAWQRSLNGEEPPIINGRTGAQRFFIAFADVHRTKMTKEYEAILRTASPYPPAEFRVNGVVRNIDAWYEAFDIAPTDDLYLAPEDRVHIW